MATKDDSEAEADKRQRKFYDKLAKDADGDPASRRGTHRVAFLAVRDLVEGALKRGYTMTRIWRGLRDEGQLSMAYSTFLAHCKRSGLSGEAPAAVASPRAVPGAREPGSAVLGAREPGSAVPGAREPGSSTAPKRFVHKSVPDPSLMAPAKGPDRGPR